MSGWQPIETAPKDGTVVDLWAHWPESDEWRRSADAVWDADMGDWRAGQYSFNQYVRPPTVTHWMPLPSAPGDGAGDRTASNAHADAVPGNPPNPTPPLGVPAIPDELREAVVRKPTKSQRALLELARRSPKGNPWPLISIQQRTGGAKARSFAQMQEWGWFDRDNIITSAGLDALRALSAPDGGGV